MPSDASWLMPITGKPRVRDQSTQCVSDSMESCDPRYRWPVEMSQYLRADAQIRRMRLRIIHRPGRGDAAAAAWIFRGAGHGRCAAAPPR